MTSNPPLGPFSRPPALAHVDGRTREARLMRQFRAELVEHCGGKPTATQCAMIDSAVQLQLRLKLMDAADAGAGYMSERNGREYLAWHNSLVRTLRSLGIKRATQSAPDITDYLAARRASDA